MPSAVPNPEQDDLNVLVALNPVEIDELPWEPLPRAAWRVAQGALAPRRHRAGHAPLRAGLELARRGSSRRAPSHLGDLRRRHYRRSAPARRLLHPRAPGIKHPTENVGPDGATLLQMYRPHGPHVAETWSLSRRRPPARRRAATRSSASGLRVASVGIGQQGRGHRCSREVRGACDIGTRRCPDHRQRRCHRPPAQRPGEKFSTDRSAPVVSSLP